MHCDSSNTAWPSALHLKPRSAPTRDRSAAKYRNGLGSHSSPHTRAFDHKPKRSTRIHTPETHCLPHFCPHYATTPSAHLQIQADGRRNRKHSQRKSQNTYMKFDHPGQSLPPRPVHDNCTSAMAHTIVHIWACFPSSPQQYTRLNRPSL